jgi:hypothetical protein
VSKGKSPPFVMLPWHVMDSAAYWNLGSFERDLLMQMCRHYNYARSEIEVSCRYATKWWPKRDKDTVGAGLRKLTAAGLISEVHKGCLTRRGGAIGTTWRIEFYKGGSLHREAEGKG